MKFVWVEIRSTLDKGGYHGASRGSVDVGVAVQYRDGAWRTLGVVVAAEGGITYSTVSEREGPVGAFDGAGAVDSFVRSVCWVVSVAAS